MPQVLEKYPLTPPDPTLPTFKRKKFTEEEVSKIASAGLLATLRVELIEGDVVEKMPKNALHAMFLAYVLHALTGIFGLEYVLPDFTLFIDPWNLPEPDAAVLTRPMQDFARLGRPRAAEVRLLVEISDETLSYDLTTKAHLYARASIPEYWVMAVSRRKLIVHRQPTSDGYTDVQEYDEAETIEPLAAPGKPLTVQSLMP